MNIDNSPFLERLKSGRGVKLQESQVGHRRTKSGTRAVTNSMKGTETILDNYLADLDRAIVLGGHSLENTIPSITIIKCRISSQVYVRCLVPVVCTATYIPSNDLIVCVIM